MVTGGSITAHERALVDLSHWLARTLQYSAKHPACQQIAEKTLASVTTALAEQSPLVVGTLKDDVLVQGVSSRTPAIRQRIGPCLHERGAMVLRIVHGVTLDELASLVDILSLPAQTVFDRGGLLRLTMDAGLARVQIDELAHDVTVEEREAQRRRARLRSFFKEILLGLLARRAIDGIVAEHLVELLEHPDIAVAILEEDAAGISDATAGLALMVRQEEQRSGLQLVDKLRTVLLMLSPRSRDRVLLGFPTLVDEFRAALGWAMDGFSEADLARFVMPAVRSHGAELDVVLYALSAAVPHEGTRLSALRWLGQAFFDWPDDQDVATEALRAMAGPVQDYESFRPERLVLQASAAHALAAREAVAAPSASHAAGSRWSSKPPSPDGPPAFDGRRSIAEVIGIATRTRTFDRFCQGLPPAAESALAEGSTVTALGVMRGLASVAVPEWRDVAMRSLSRVATASAQRVLSDLDADADGALVEEEGLEEVTLVVRLLGAFAPTTVLERLDVSENRKLRRILLDTLPKSGAALLPAVRARLASDKWFVVRNAVLLVPRVGGTAHDLEAAHRHPDDRVRLEVVRSLRALPPDDAVMALATRMLDDATGEVRRNAALLLRGELLGEATVGALARYAIDETRHEESRAAVVEALGRCSLDVAAQALFEMLEPRGLLESGATSNIRNVAAAALHRSPAPAARELFAKGLASSVRRVRKACERAAGVPG